MKARDFIIETIMVVPSGDGQWKTVDTATGADLGTYKTKVQANNAAGKARLEKAKANAGDKVAKKSGANSFGKTVLGKMFGIGQDDADTKKSSSDDKDKKTDPDTDDDDDKDTKKKTSGLAKKLFSGFSASIIGKVVMGFIVTPLELMNDLDRFADAYENNNCDRNAKEVLAAQQMLADNLTANVTATFLAVASGAASAALLTKFFGVLGPFGIGTAFIAGLSGTAIAYVAMQMAKDTDLMKSIANWLANNILDRRTLKSYSFARDCGSMNEAEESNDLDNAEKELKQAFGNFLDNNKKIKRAIAKAS